MNKNEVARMKTVSLHNKYIHFEKICGRGYDERKTEVWDVINNKTEEPLARIEWYSHWRQYVFTPEANTVYDNGCLEAILSFVSQLNRKHTGKTESEPQPTRDEVRKYMKERKEGMK